jgi:hypothetical protein
VKLLRISLASLAACAALAVPAHADTGNGLYEPFPSPTSDVVAQDFVAGLPGGIAFTDPSGLDLERGVLVGKPAVAAYAVGRTAGERGGAGDSGFAPSFGWPLALVLLAAVLGAAGLLAARRT